MSFNEKIILNDGRQMPLLGLGVYKAVGENEVEQAIADAADAGYRLIDTASVYKNEDGVGRNQGSYHTKRGIIRYNENMEYRTENRRRGRYFQQKSGAPGT